MKLQLQLSTISNRSSTLIVDAAAVSAAELHDAVADALGLDAATVKIRATAAPRGRALPRTAGVSLADDAEARSALGLPDDAADGFVVALTVFGVRCKVAAAAAAKHTTNSTVVADDALQQPATASSAQDATPSRQVIPTTSSAARSPGGASAATPGGPGGVAVPPVGVLRGVVREVEQAPVHRRRRTIINNPVIDSMCAQVRASPEPDRSLEVLVNKVNAVCPEFVEKIVRRYPEAFLDAVNGVVGAITFPDPILGAAGGGSDGGVSLQLFGGGADASGDGAAAGGGDADITIDIPGDAVTADALLNALGQALLMGIAAAAAAEATDGDEDAARMAAQLFAGGASGSSTASDDEDDDGDDEDAEETGEVGMNESPARRRDRRQQHDEEGEDVAASDERDVVRLRKEQRALESLVRSRNYSAAAGHLHNVWRRARLLQLKVAQRENPHPATSSVLADLRKLMGECLVSALHAVSRAIRLRLAELCAPQVPSATSGDATANSPTTASSPGAASTAESEATNVSSSSVPRYDDMVHSNTVLAALDDAILLEAIGSSMMANYAAADAPEPDAATALAVHAWFRGLREMSDTCFGLLELRRPSPSNAVPLRAIHGAGDASPFGTGSHTPRHLVDTARRFVDRHGGRSGVIAAVKEFEQRVHANSAGSDPAAPGLRSNATPSSGGAMTTTTTPAAVAWTTQSWMAAASFEMAEYEHQVLRLQRLAQQESASFVVYSSQLCFYREMTAGNGLNPLMTLQDYLATRFVADDTSAASFAFSITVGAEEHHGAPRRNSVATEDGGDSGTPRSSSVPQRSSSAVVVRMSATLLHGVVATVNSALPRLAGTHTSNAASGGGVQAAIAFESALSDLGKSLVQPIMEALPPVPVNTANNTSHHADGDAAASPDPSPPSSEAASVPHVTFVTLFSHDVDDVDASGGALAVIPFHALPLSSEGSSSARLIDAYATTVTPSITSLMAAWQASESPVVRSRIRGGPTRQRRQPWLSATAARALNVKAQRERGAEEAIRWTLLGDTGAPRVGSGIAADLFIATRTDPATAKGAFFAPLVSNAVVSVRRDDVGAPGSPSAAAGQSDDDDSADEDETPGRTMTDDAFATPTRSHSTAFIDDVDLSRAFRVHAVRGLLEQLSSGAAEPTKLAHAFRSAVLDARAKLANATTSSGSSCNDLATFIWAPLTLLHSGRRLDAVHAHLRGQRDASVARASSLRARLSMRGPVSVTENANIRYVQQHNVPALIDSLCRELLASRPDSEAGVLDTLIDVLEGMMPAIQEERDVNGGGDQHLMTPTPPRQPPSSNPSGRSPAPRPPPRG